MGVFDQVERKLRSAYNGVFARAFKANVQPVEIASAIRSAMDDRVVSGSRGRNVVPNVFTIELAESDYERLLDDPELESDLVVAAEQHAEEQHYTPGGPIDILLAAHDDLETGVFRVRPSTTRHPRSSGLTGQSPVVDHRYPGPAQDVDPEADDEAAYAVARDDDAPQERPWAADVPVPPPPVPSHPAPRPAVDPAPPRRRVNPADRPYLDIDGDRYPLMSSLTVLGRDDNADIMLDDPGISRRHSEIRVTVDGRHLLTSIRDLGSTNGTYVNGERITSVRLEDGDQLTLGRTTATFRAGRA